MLKNPTIRIADLRQIVDDLLAHVEKVHGPEVPIDKDYYWSLGNDVLYDTQRSVGNIDEIGSLGDDWEFLLNMKGTDIRNEGPSLMLAHAAPLLRYIGETVGA